jgi:tetratricopeptide (TPR) repeat protein
MKQVTHLFFFALMLLFTHTGNLLKAQRNNVSINKGNQLYKQNNFEAAKQHYQKAIQQDVKNAVAHYNHGNSQYKGNEFDESLQSYDNTIQNNAKKPLKEKSFYNKGVVYMKQKNLPESITAWKEALKLDPNDQQARENLQKALLEQKKQEQEQEQKKQDNQHQKKQNNQQQQLPPQSKLTKKQIEQLLKSMQQKEKEIQKKLQQNKSASNGPEKDW